MKKELWLLNLTKLDVSLADLGVKVPAQGTINVYKYNPHITEEQVKRSMEDGSLSRRLAGKILKVIKKPGPVNIELVKEAKDDASPINIRKTKSSIVIESNIDDLESDGESFDFADYGVSDAITYNRDEYGVVSALQKQDPDPEPAESDTELKIREESGLSKQTQMVIDTSKKSSHPMGAVAEFSSRTDQPFIVAKTDRTKPADAETPEENMPEKADDGAIVMEIKEEEEKTEAPSEPKKAAAKKSRPKKAKAKTAAKTKGKAKK